MPGPNARASGGGALTPSLWRLALIDLLPKLFQLVK
jgi:hypothetical protein